MKLGESWDYTTQSIRRSWWVILDKELSLQMKLQFSEFTIDLAFIWSDSLIEPYVYSN